MLETILPSICKHCILLELSYSVVMDQY